MDFKAKELVLVAAATTVTHKSTATSIDLGIYELNKMSFHMFLPVAIVNLKKDTHHWAVPFWSVQNSNAPNMMLNFVEQKVGDTIVNVPTLINPKRIKKGDVLSKELQDAKPPADPNAKKQRTE